jgi:hypothetical protein
MRLTFRWFEKAVCERESNKAGEGKNKEREELPLSRTLASSLGMGTAWTPPLTCSS